MVRTGLRQVLASITVIPKWHDWQGMDQLTVKIENRRRDLAQASDDEARKKKGRSFRRQDTMMTMPTMGISKFRVSLAEQNL